MREEADREDGVGIDDSSKEVKLLDAESLKIGTGENQVASFLISLDRLEELDGRCRGSTDSRSDGGS